MVIFLCEFGYVNAGLLKVNGIKNCSIYNVESYTSTAVFQVLVMF
jgi:hypothetical protein